MKKKYLIVVADYYKDIANGLISSALKIIPKKNTLLLANTANQGTYCLKK